MKYIIKTTGFLITLVILLTGIPVTQVQAASKPVISSSQVKINKNYCSVKNGKKIKLAAKYRKKDITKKCTWKSSKKSVATISKAGVLTAKKAGTTYVTVKYKGKTSKKLKIVVKADTEPASDSDNTSSKGFIITYNKNSKNKPDKLNGPATQKITAASGEILKFSTTVTPASGKKFLGWYDAPAGGSRIYETYKPTDDMTLYAHYTDENTQQITFSLGCTYGSEKVSFMGEYTPQANESYEYPSMQWGRGPMDISDLNNIMWKHRYFVSDKKTVTFDTLPKPYIPRYTFKGWYTSDQNSYWTRDEGTKVKSGQDISTDITVLYVCFSKKLTISFDDLHGGTYPDIVVDTYSSIKDCGVKLPVPDILGVTLDGWHVSSAPSDGMPIRDDYVFGNLIFNEGFECHHTAIDSTDPLSVCNKLCRDLRDLNIHWEYDHGSRGTWADIEVYEETDHITLYPKYTTRRALFEFDPKGGNFSKTAEANDGLTVYDETESDFKKGFGYRNLTTDSYYGSIEEYIPGHEGKRGWTYSANNSKLPVVSKSNYIFDGWITSDGTKLTEDIWVTGNMTFSAKWIPGNCYVMFDPTDGTLTQEERDRMGLDGSWSYKVTTESTVSGSGKQLPVPVSSEGRKFEGWYTKDGEEVTKDTKITGDIMLYAHWGTKTGSKPET